MYTTKQTKQTYKQILKNNDQSNFQIFTAYEQMSVLVKL